MELLVSSARPGETISYRIVNTGAVELICGLPNRLEREASEGWIPMNKETLFPLLGFGVAPGQDRVLEARIPPHAPAGRYRLRADVSTDHGGGTVQLSAQFDVLSGDKELWPAR